MATNLPVIPTVYGVSWGEYNTGTFSGWPTPSNEYETAQPSAPTNEVVILHLKPSELSPPLGHSPGPRSHGGDRGRRSARPNDEPRHPHESLRRSR